MNLIVKKEADNSFTFCESTDGVTYDGQKNGGTDIKLSFSDDNLNVTIIGGEVNSYKSGNLFYDNGGVIVAYTSVLDFISTLKSEGFKTTYNTYTENGAIAVGNSMTKFRDNFILGSPDTKVWQVIRTTPNNGYLGRGGNASGSSYLRIFVSPYESGSNITLISKEKFKLPIKLGFLLSQSQRVLGSQFTISLVGCNENGVIEKVTPPTPLPISGTISITSNVATINFASTHNINGLERLVVYGNIDSRLNVGAVQATIIDAYTITVPCALVNGTYTAGGFVKLSPVDCFDSNSVGLTTENTTVTNASYFARRNGASVRNQNQTIGTTTATQNGNSQPYSDAFSASTYNELIATMQDVILTSKPVDVLTGNNNSLRYSSVIPDEEKYYKIKIEAKNLENITKVVAKIVSIAKTGITTATVVTDVPHGLNTSSFVQIYGVRDITNFPNLTTQTQVASVISPTEFTIIIGGAVTATSAGGIVALVNGSQVIVGAQNINIQSISRTNDILTVIGNGTFASVLNGEMWYLAGCNATSLGLYDGAYKVLRASTTTLELESIGDSFASINCGGAVIRATENRVHSIQLLDYTRLIVEQSNQNGMIDLQKAITVLIGNAITATISGNPVIGSGANTIGNVNVIGQAAHDAVIAGNPLRGAVRAVTANYTPVASGDQADIIGTLTGIQVVRQNSIPELEFQGVVTIVNITSTALQAAAGAGFKRYLTNLVYQNTNAIATVFNILRGTTVIHTISAPASMANPVPISFSGTPLQTGANEALNVQAVTTGANLIVNFQGYTAP